MRKLLLSAVAFLSMTGLAIAVEVRVVSYDKEKKEVKVKEGDAEKTYKITDATKVYITDKDGNKTEGKVEDLTRRLEFTGKGGGGGKGRATKLDITTDGDKITEVKMQGRKKN
ncbi:MAG TPA: hypothetical protein VKE74_01455 [Gemmataceae bacterium]|nr:hypothetical protein [Gemmataceae bacterium]